LNNSYLDRWHAQHVTPRHNTTQLATTLNNEQRNHRVTGHRCIKPVVARTTKNDKHLNSIALFGLQYNAKIHAKVVHLLGLFGFPPLDGADSLFTEK
jgi:hypothetical protein